MLNTQLRQHIEQVTRAEATIKRIQQENTELLEKAKQSVGFKQPYEIKFIRIEKLVPKIVEKITEEKDFSSFLNIEAKAELLEAERREIEKRVYAEFEDRIKKLECNILAY